MYKHDKVEIVYCSTFRTCPHFMTKLGVYMFNQLKRLYCRVPSYGQLITRRGEAKKCWYNDTTSSANYFSLMLKGSRGGLFTSSTFYLVLTENCYEDALKRGELHLKHIDEGIPFGKYLGIKRIEVKDARIPYAADCVFLHVFRYLRGGKLEDRMLVLSERQFRRAISRAKSRPDLVVRKRWCDGIVKLLHQIFCKNK